MTATVELTREQKRELIANACGWKLHYSGDGFAYHSEYCPDGKYVRVPDYFGSLDAIHEAEKVLNDEQLNRYYVEMSNFPSSVSRRTFMATAEQRAEAFGRALGLW